MKKIEWLVVGVSVVGWIATAHAAATDQQKCAAAKIAAAAKYAACRAGADKKAELTEATADYTKCDQKQLDAWTKIEGKYGARCLTSGDQAAVKTEISAVTACLVDRLAPAGVTPSIQVECVPCPAGGVVVDGTCWILGAAGDSCTAVCAQHDMAYDDKTDTYLSTTGGAMGRCLFVMEQFGHPYTSSSDFMRGVPNMGLGCAYSGTRAYLTGTATAQGSYAGYQRACGCR